MCINRSASSSSVPRSVSGGGFFTGSKFRYTGRVEREVLEEMAQLSRQEPTITRVGSIRKKSSSVPATPSTPIVNELMNFHDGSKLIIVYSRNLNFVRDVTNDFPCKKLRHFSSTPRIIPAYRFFCFSV